MSHHLFAKPVSLASSEAMMEQASTESQDIGKLEGSRVLSSLEGLDFFVTDVSCGDNIVAVETASAVAVAAFPSVGVVMLSAGAKNLVVHARVPSERADAPAAATRLVAEALADIPHVMQDGACDICATAVVYADPSTGRDPMNDKDLARTAVATYMQDEGLFGDDDEIEDDEDFRGEYATSSNYTY